MAMRKKWMLLGYVLLLAALAFAVDAGLAAMMVLHSTDRTIVEVRSNAR
jgi:hypothetical protein